MEIDIIEPDFYYHIYDRGIDRQPIFKQDNHYHKFLELSIKYIPGFADVLAYCLIPNHFHFLLYIRPTRTGVSNPLAVLLNSYAQWYNNMTDRTGGLFQSPFKRKRITSQEYLKQAVYYIHRNPLHHGICSSPFEYPYSSIQTYANNSMSFVKKELVLDMFDGPSHFRDYHLMKFQEFEENFFDDDL